MASTIKLILLIVFFGDTRITNIAIGLLGYLSNILIFRKCGQAPWKALIPAYNDYALAQCADREMEGRITFTISILMLPIMIALSIFSEQDEMVWVFCSILYLVLSIINLIYYMRVYLGLFENFGLSKWWILLAWTPLPFLILALSKKRQPLKKVSEIDRAEKEYFSRNVSVLESGLTINIKERTARDFFKKKRLLSEIHLNIKPGSMVLLLGGSGAGKTTLLNAVIGYEKANAEISLDEENVYKKYKKMMYKIGFVPQLDLMRGSDTVYRTLADAAALRLPQNFSRAERKARVEEVMNIFGLTPVKGNLVDKLSGGQRKRLSIAMEFLSNPTLFILDEPDSGLDGVMARELMQQLRMIADQGKIIIVITHTPDRVIDLFDDVIVLAKDKNRTGRLAYYGPIDEAKEFFERESMERIVKSINRPEEGGDGRADELIQKYAEVTA